MFCVNVAFSRVNGHVDVEPMSYFRRSSGSRCFRPCVGRGRISFIVLQKLVLVFASISVQLCDFPATRTLGSERLQLAKQKEA